MTIPEGHVRDRIRRQHHNAFQPLDVSGDRVITPIDALLLINFLNRETVFVLRDRTPYSPSQFLDVDHDEFATPTDVIIIINYLNRMAGGEGESGVRYSSSPRSVAGQADMAAYEAPLSDCEAKGLQMSEIIDSLAEERRRRMNDLQ
ncbi:MAG: hypothetical protein KDB03_24230 [Planctomycetales bacterium]|nr:hypothetical protein [Planctomycetales bacterium]